ncbi:deazaflavin-dependent nitroreductase [Nocardia seriolae]|uniref:Uncharacterized protein n=1 Tax=Nocardia seriolae TaxID=37332 RepID=A0A0B8NFR3_9NOCA|nr:deazaflavin-dependent nitroreductase [Nocardia seriolae]MTJ62988.1 deazaflavin-dependent nitroreductase [Nocardia seriolae]MTJ73730.1 deazaflavin-dependent nitroreductase [Nocardia seriolae]MTJ88015.1 deazaflavin-dependent nitroreductase [Nocardia seriolae]MTK32005.1 deazaflavin-dependent nitroreductase [Nocardia seriolae]MTK40920.1 deazaflavin-dependent nitroreductase [Nocardia seriolae]
MSKQQIRNRIVIASHRIGLPFGPMHLLGVPGRKTGVLRVTPVAPVSVAGRRYLVEAYPNSDWVKNARRAGHGVLARGHRAERVNLVEIPAAERGSILREFPAQNPRGVGAFVRNGLVESPSPDAFAAAAPRCPVFRVDPM